MSLGFRRLRLFGLVGSFSQLVKVRDDGNILTGRP